MTPKDIAIYLDTEGCIGSAYKPVTAAAPVTGLDVDPETRCDKCKQGQAVKIMNCGDHFHSLCVPCAEVEKTSTVCFLAGGPGQ